MARRPRTHPSSLLQRLFREGTAAGLSDAELVARFARTRDNEAFAGLVARHGPMVMAVCRGLLGPGGDADDAFQATFLVLLNRIGTFPVGPSLSGWLYRVARRVSRQARLSHARRRRRESAAEPRAGSAAERDPERSEILGVIRQEVDLLPERYRAPIVLCDLQGLTRDEAAELLGCPAGTVGGRLARGRQRLRDRLERRGVSPAVAFPIPSGLSPTAPSWATSLEAATRSASLLASGSPATPEVLSLAARSSRAVAAVPVKTAIALAVLACLTVGLVAARRAGEPPDVPADPPPAPAKRPAEAAKAPVPDPVPGPDLDDPKLAGHFAGRVTGPDDEPMEGARLFIVPSSSAATTPGPVRARSGADGRFEFDAPDMTYTSLDGLPRRRPGLLIASADGYAPDGIATWGETGSSFRSHWDPVKGAEPVLRLVRDDVPIHGRLLDHDGRPLAGARVQLTALQVPWKHDLDAHLKKYSLSKNEVWMFDYDRSLTRPGLLPGVETETVTDGDGRFRFSGLGRDRLADLTVTAPSVVQSYLTVMTCEAPDVVLDRDLDGNATRATLGAGFTLRLGVGRTVSGLVRDRETHEPIPGMWVGFRTLHWLKSRVGVPAVLTDANGRFTVSGIHPAYNPLALEAVPQPGMTYVMAQGVVEGRSDLVIECTRGIPFRLKLVDEAGEGVDAQVEYQPVMPNSHIEGLLRGANFNGGHSLSVAARRDRGVYEGFVLPGPGAVLVTEAGPPVYRRAQVDPKAFFAPGKTDWTDQELYTAYGNDVFLTIAYGSAVQNDYAAIVLVNPPVGSKPLELTATLVRDRPRQVTFLDPEGNPVVGVDTQGMTSFPYDSEPRLRAATIPLRNIHPDHSRRITFFKQDRKLVGFLMARGDGETPYTLRMQPWATLTGRILDENGKAINMPATLSMSTRLLFASHDDPGIGQLPDSNTEPDGRFRIERLVPGQRYSARVYRGIGRYAGVAFEDLTLQPGEVRDLGDIRTKAPVDVRGQ
jgi:RNA polymerase sigma factor (sigma-70 family)